MLSASRTASPNWFLAPLVALSLFWSDGLSAQTKGTLPGYVVKEFGQPPAVPDGAHSAALRAAIQTAFVDSFSQSNWGGRPTGRPCRDRCVQ
jgi:hypothetical protein